jgi:glycosyltransferase involved in cell wall biosynthesis
MKIAVCIPTYKAHLPLLKRCLDSIQAQTRRPDTVVVSASSCDSKDIVLLDYPFPLLLLASPHHQDAAANRNCAAEAIRNSVDILTFIDSDDEMVPERLAFLERAFVESGADFVLHSFVDMKHTQSRERTSYQLHQDPFTVDLRPYCGVVLKPGIPGPIHQAHASIRAALFDTHRYAGGLMVCTTTGKSYTWEDTEYNRRLFVSGKKGAYLSTQLSLYY